MSSKLYLLTYLDLGQKFSKLKKLPDFIRAPPLLEYQVANISFISVQELTVMDMNFGEFKWFIWSSSS